MKQTKNDGKYWVDHHTRGYSGWLVDADNVEKPVMPPYVGAMLVRLDRPNQIITKPYTGKESQWSPRATASPISETAKAKIAYAALRELAFAQGDHSAGRLEFQSIMPEEKRIGLTQRGPVALDPKAKDDIRQELWDAVMVVLNR